MKIYYVLKNSTVQMEQMINFDFFKEIPFNVDRDYSYYETESLSFMLEPIASFIYMDSIVLKDNLNSSQEVLALLQKRISSLNFQQ